MTLLDEAHAYGRRGWPVFPIQPPVPGDAKSGKLPFGGTHGFKDATTNPNMIERWWDRWPDASIGLATGRAAGVWVLDVDGARGAASLTQLEAELGPLPVTLEVVTGGGGRHLYFLWHEGREIRNKQGLWKKGSGLDVRGEGGYVILPPSPHHSGSTYRWLTTPNDPIAAAPKAWLDLVCPPKPPAPAPWERVDPRPAPPPQAVQPLFENGRLPLLERARLYLRQVDPAVQGQGGHNALLWAARCLVVGFELPTETALQLLWSDYNPRCVPPWNPENAIDRKDFERKVDQARSTPAGKPQGWLLDQYGYRTRDDAAMAAIGASSAAALLESAKRRLEIAPETVVAPEPKGTTVLPPTDDRKAFPIEHFPEKIRNLVIAVSESHNVDTSWAALPALAVAGASMGNAWRLELKRGFVVPPILWVCLVGPNGSNKSGPPKAIMDPLRRTLPVEAIGEPMLNPQGRMVVSDATLEAVLQRLNEGRRGLLMFRDELAGWVGSFGAYKKGGGGDEQAWLEFWSGDHYTVDRKTNDQQLHIPAASVSVLGGIQPETLWKTFDPDRFASGFVPRILIACPPRRTSFWNESEVDPQAERHWEEAITWLRCTPFAGLDTASGTFIPRRVSLVEGTAPKVAYTTFYNSVSLEMEDAALKDGARGFLSKARVQCGRLALIHHGLRVACGSLNLDEPVALESVQAGAAWARWCLEEQLRLYGFGSEKNRQTNAEKLYSKIRDKCPTKSATVRQVMRLNSSLFEDKDKAAAAMGQLVELGLARWQDHTKDKIVLIEEVTRV